MAPVHARAEIVLVDVVDRGFCAETKQGKSTGFEHPVKIRQQRLMLFAWDMDNGVVGGDPVEGTLIEVQFGHILANKFRPGQALLCQLDLCFGEIDTRYLKTL